MIIINICMKTLKNTRLTPKINEHHYCVFDFFYLFCICGIRFHWPLRKVMVVNTTLFPSNFHCLIYFCRNIALGSYTFSNIIERNRKIFLWLYMAPIPIEWIYWKFSYYKCFPLMLNHNLPLFVDGHIFAYAWKKKKHQSEILSFFQLSSWVYYL